MKICGIVLAAGCSSRAGEFKMIHKISNKPMIEYVIDSMNSICDSVVIVTGHEKETLSYLVCKYGKVRLIYNENYLEGMFGSILTGLNDFDADAALICPGDCPAISLDTYFELTKDDFGVQVPFFKGDPGHPIYVRKDFVLKLKCGHFTNLKEFIKNYEYHAVPVDDPAILMDVDYTEDFIKIENYIKGTEHD
ncbi:MAG: nucleotidyltransferase family protein [Clostridiales bacterium]|nr:nucleotidyltransferase family protein [Clostridiales bacterium]